LSKIILRIIYEYANEIYFFPERIIGGGEQDRTADPLLAKQVLSQLSYAPK
jgi:hypothetical protein